MVLVALVLFLVMVRLNSLCVLLILVDSWLSAAMIRLSRVCL